MGDVRVTLSGYATDTTNQRMELTAVINGLQWLGEHGGPGAPVTIVTDSQYVVGLQDRETKLVHNEYLTRKGKLRNNADLVREMLQLVANGPTEFVKVKAHAHNDDAVNYNHEADKLCRRIVREQVALKIA